LNKVQFSKNRIIQVDKLCHGVLFSCGGQISLNSASTLVFVQT
jgi:hypothetical protein